MTNLPPPPGEYRPPMPGDYPQQGNYPPSPSNFPPPGNYPRPRWVLPAAAGR